MHRPDPTEVYPKLEGLDYANEMLLESFNRAITAVEESEAYEGKVQGIKKIDAKYEKAMKDWEFDRKGANTADLVGVSAVRKYAVDAIEYQSDLLERIVQLLEASHEG